MGGMSAGMLSKMLFDCHSRACKIVGTREKWECRKRYNDQLVEAAFMNTGDAWNMAMRIIGNTNTEDADGTTPPVDIAMQLASGPDVAPETPVTSSVCFWTSCPF